MAEPLFHSLGGDYPEIMGVLSSQIGSLYLKKPVHLGELIRHH